MDDPIFTELRKLVGQHEKIVYEAVKADTVAQLPHESQLFAKAMQEHMHLKHIHNALEFADLREGEPYEIEAAADGQEALEAISRRRPDVILLDLLMPRMDGFTVIEHLRQDPEHRMIPVIVLTAKTLTAAEQAALEQSARKVIQKRGLDRDHFIGELRGALQAYRDETRRDRT